MKKRLLSLAMVLVMCLGLLPAAAAADGHTDVKFHFSSVVDSAWAEGAQIQQITTSSTEKIVQVGGYDVYVPEGATSPENVSSVTEITNQTTLNSGWYIVKPAATQKAEEPDVKINNRMVVKGDVHLILAEGATLQAEGGIQVEAGNSLTIWGQKAASTGALRALRTTQTNVAPISDDGNAAIGGNMNNDEQLHTAGTITINGGLVEAVSSLGAAIGGGHGSRSSWYGGAAGSVIINDGHVIAQSITGAGIGGGQGNAFAGAGGEVAIRGGTVDASSSDGAGIGAGTGNQGVYSGKSLVSITGGNVKAVSHRGAGIGAGLTQTDSKNVGADVTISGGTVTAHSVYGAAVGGGDIGGTSSKIGSPGSFSTGTNGHAVIFASSLSQVGIADTSKRQQWSGVIFNGERLSDEEMLEGQIYGSPTLQGNVLLPAKYTYKNSSMEDCFVKYQLHILQDKTLTIGPGATLTNEMPIYCDGTIVNQGTIDNTKGDIGQATNLKATFRVLNGTWANGWTGDITGVTIYKKAPQEVFTEETIPFKTQALMQSQIPTGMKPDIETYPELSAEGTWSPATDKELTEDTTFVYGFVGRQPYDEPVIQYDFLTSKLTGFVAGGSYTINDSKVTPESDGTLMINVFWFGKDVSIMRMADKTGENSPPQSLAIPARPSEPNLDTQRTTGSNKNDGKITGLCADKSYEYRNESDEEEICQSVTPGATEITGLAPGSYLVREKATASSFAGLYTKVIVQAPEKYVLEIAPVSFDAIAVGDGQPAPKAIEITNKGTQEATISKVTVAPTDAFVVAGSGASVPVGESLNTWTIQPTAGLDVGKHEATITVTYDEGKTATAKAVFTVLPRQNQPAVKINYKNEQLTGFVAEGTYAIAEDAPKAITGTSIPVAPYMGKTITIVHKGDDTTVMDSAAQSLEVPTKAAAPAGLQGQAPSQKGRSDGKITGLEKAKHYEYRASGAQGWKPVAADATDITGLPAGTYEVREAAKTDAFASVAADVVVAEGAAPPAPPAPPVKPDIPETTENPDGSTTVTETKKDGTTVETTTNPNGDKTVVENKKDGSTVTTETNKAGDKSVTETDKHGNSTTEVKQADGTTAKASTNAKGETQAEVKLSGKAVQNAEKAGEPAALPIPPVEAQPTTEDAPVVKITTGSKTPVKVEIPVSNMTPGTVPVIVAADGTERVVPQSAQTETGVVLSVEDGSTVKLVDAAKEFQDIPETFWAADAVAFVSARELFNGTAPGTFTPNASTTRGQLMTVLARLAGADTTGDPIRKGMEWAVENGVSDGTNPQGTMSRQQLATMLWRLDGEPESSFSLTNTDQGAIASYAETAMAWAVENGVMGGYADGSLKPENTASRAHVAAMVSRYINR